MTLKRFAEIRLGNLKDFHLFTLNDEEAYAAATELRRPPLTFKNQVFIKLPRQAGTKKNYCLCQLANSDICFESPDGDLATPLL
jgi:hypothetical protein